MFNVISNCNRHSHLKGLKGSRNSSGLVETRRYSSSMNGISLLADELTVDTLAICLFLNQSQFQDIRKNDKIETYARVLVDKKYEYYITGRSRQASNFFQIHFMSFVVFDQI